MDRLFPPPALAPIELLSCGLVAAAEAVLGGVALATEGAVVAMERVSAKEKRARAVGSRIIRVLESWVARIRVGDMYVGW